MNMRIKNVLSRQWDGYGRYHCLRRNLFLHAVAVPVFLLGNVLLVLSLACAMWAGAVAGIVLMMASLVAQGRGHRAEPRAPEPFASPANAVLRLFAEQWISFPRFVFSGQWNRAVREASEPGTPSS